LLDLNPPVIPEGEPGSICVLEHKHRAGGHAPPQLHISLGVGMIDLQFHLPRARVAEQHGPDAPVGLFDVAPVTRAVLTDALDLDFPDYEDAVLHEAARHAGAEAIVTRDPKGFAKARLKVYRPDELLRFIQATPQS
jgi:hypothetical protein